MKRKQEQDTVCAMIRLYCRGRHGADELCSDCSALLDYANQRLSACPYGDEKPKCRVCPIHCYAPEMRERIAEVMRYAGPRMMIQHPVMGLRHLLNRSKPEKP
ncbi:MAG: nitrous oxide-stimulated promoter family protein [Verrucomicrobia bacterium]|jgi:hypothetical protein|nr:nitrous oxide-stimulated promoter family protein [Verrucomicrobiota bacterium]